MWLPTGVGQEPAAPLGPLPLMTNRVFLVKMGSLAF